MSVGDAVRGKCENILSSRVQEHWRDFFIDEYIEDIYNKRLPLEFDGCAISARS